MNVKIIGNEFESEIMEIENGQEEEVSKKLMMLQEKGIKELRVVELVERDVTDTFAIRYVENDGKKMFIGPGNQPSYVAKYHLEDTTPRQPKTQSFSHPNIVFAQADVKIHKITPTIEIIAKGNGGTK